MKRHIEPTSVIQDLLSIRMKSNDNEGELLSACHKHKVHKDKNNTIIKFGTRWKGLCLQAT